MSVTVLPLEASQIGMLVPGAAEFYRASRFLSDFTPRRFEEVWADLIKSGTGMIFAMWRNGEIVGAIGGMVHREIYGEYTVGEELFWYVREGFRGGGMFLYRKLEAWARSKGARTMQMVHLSDVSPEIARTLYLRDGFEEVETRYVKRFA